MPWPRRAVLDRAEPARCRVRRASGRASGPGLTCGLSGGRGWQLLAALLGLLWLSACGRSTPLRLLALERFDQAGVRCFLNEELTLHFSRALDPASVQGGSARLLDLVGRPVAGEFEVSGRRLLFRPRLPCRSDLGDGGLRPGAEYRLELDGFPRLSALRSRDGWPLAESLVLPVSCVSSGDPQGLFRGMSLAPAEPLSVERFRLGPLDPLVLRSAQALDPRSLEPESFALFALGPAGERPERIPLRLELLDNRQAGARLALLPVAAGEGAARRALPLGELLLVARDGAPGLRDLGGQRVLAGFGSSPLDGVRLEVEESADGGTAEGALASVGEDFAGSNPGLGLPSGADGTARWAGNGRLEVRWPAAAGDGSDGEQRRDGAEPLPLRLSATRLELSGEQRLPPQGLACLRAQGRLEIRGSLRRRVQAGPAAPGPTEDPADWWKRLRGLPPESLVPEFRFDPAQQLSAWLQAAELLDAPWTVLIAGGDLIVTGQLDLDGPLLLVAGGTVRIDGAVLASECVTSLPRRGEPRFGTARGLPLALDAPLGNPLRAPLRIAAEGALPAPAPGFEGWADCELVGRSGSGELDLTFSGTRPGPQGAGQRVGPVGDPRLLESAGALEFRAELRLFPGTPEWDPPWLDSLRVRYALRR